jgi:hypothetical protein
MLEVAVGVGCYCCMTDRSGVSLLFSMVINVDDFTLICGGWLWHSVAYMRYFYVFKTRECQVTQASKFCGLAYNILSIITAVCLLLVPFWYL